MHGLLEEGLNRGVFMVWGVGGSGDPEKSSVMKACEIILFVKREKLDSLCKPLFEVE